MNETALKERLKVIAQGKGISFNETWKQFLLERFLARLSQSAHQDRFIFKGGLLLAQYLIIGRETTDADFLMRKIKSESVAIEKAIKEVAAEKFEDGFSFSWSSLEELTQPHMLYPGFRISLSSSFGKMKDKIQLDIGVGDLVDEVEDTFQPFEYKGKPIFAGEISLLMYPVETIFAEKLETIVSKGATNGRMKDYHDVLLIIREPKLLNEKTLKKTIAATFKTRGTTFKKAILFDPDGMTLLQKQWANHIKVMNTRKAKLSLPDEINSVLAELNKWLESKF